mgnify:CR=1 FL=1
MQLGKNFKQTVWYAVGLNVLFMIIGLFAAVLSGLKRPGGTIVLVGVASTSDHFYRETDCVRKAGIKSQLTQEKKRATMFAVNDD